MPTMPGAEANLIPTSCRSETAAPAVGSGSSAQNSHPIPLPHGDPSTLPPALTPATTTRQSVALSTLWRNGTSPANAANAPPATTSGPHALLSGPATTAHAHAHAPAPSDLTTSTSSVPSTTTTLTNTLERTQSAALRALNAPAFQSRASSTAATKPKSASSKTTLSSQPVVVRTYSGPRRRSRTTAGVHPPFFSNMNGPSALSAGLACGARLPAVDDFSFSAILRAVDPEIRDAIDAIAEICARSRMSLADEYDAHLPPQGEITGTGSPWAAGMGGLVGRGRLSRLGQGWQQVEHPLTAVPEASSSSERLAGGSQGSDSKKRTRSAYGSLKSVISGVSGGGSRRKPIDTNPEPEHARSAPAAPEPPFITLITMPQASKHLSLDLSTTIKDIPESPSAELNNPSLQPEPNKPTHKRNTSSTSTFTSRTRSSTLSSLASWIPWSRTSDMDGRTSDELTKAEARLREMLVSSQNAGGMKRKAAVCAA